MLRCGNERILRLRKAPVVIVVVALVDVGVQVGGGGVVDVVIGKVGIHGEKTQW